MFEFLSNLHIGWWFLAHTLIMVVCFTSLDNFAYKRTMLFAGALQDIKDKLDELEVDIKYIQNSMVKRDVVERIAEYDDEDEE